MQQAKAQMGYSWTAILLHWSLAVLLIGLFALGLWMTSLDYYHPWYRRAPDLHRDLGLLAGLLVLWRLGLRLAGTHPGSLPGMRAGERRVSIGMHWALTLLPLPLVISGYLISTADGRPLAVFGWLEIPALVQGVEQLADTAGEIHLLLAVLLMVLALGHGVAALKHHLLDRDDTLRRMLRPGSRI